ncbi:MAG: hypothetical protein C0507_17760 [Cyanobacteria bacterium PR.3.49]|nr:hypothetical protein [Cyanobacteria bacterium PR.3.49]
MKPASFFRKSVMGALCVLSFSLVFGIGAGAQTAATSGETPELSASSHAVEQAKIKLDQCRKQLDASKALLRAAEAEYKAAVANRAALGLRTHARQLADRSGLPAHISDSAPVPVVVPVDLQSLPALGVGTQTNSTAPAQNPVDLSPTRINTVDFNAEPAPAPGAQPPAGSP